MKAAMQLAKWLLQEGNPDGANAYWAPTEASTSAIEIVRKLLEEKPVAIMPVLEASVHRAARSKIWQAVFTAACGGQTWRSTGTTDYQQAMLLARKWEREARRERAKLGRTSRKAILRVQHSGAGLTQEEVALLMRISVRAVRQIERRAIRKLMNNPIVRQLWQDYSGNLEEEDFRLTAAEIEALFSLTRTSLEQLLMQKVLDLVQA